MSVRHAALAASLASLAIAGGSARAQAPSPHSAPAPVTVQFGGFVATATTATLSFNPDRILLAGLSASAVTRLLALDSAGRVTPAVIVKLGSTSTFTLGDVIVTSVRSLAGPGSPSAEAVLGYGSIRSK